MVPWTIFQPECWRSMSVLKIKRNKGRSLPVFAIDFTKGSLCRVRCHDEGIM